MTFISNNNSKIDQKMYYMFGHKINTFSFQIFTFVYQYTFCKSVNWVTCFQKILPSSLSSHNFTKLHNPPPSVGFPAPPHLVHVATLSVLDLRHHNSGLANVVIFTVFVWCLLDWSCTSHISSCGSFENCRPYHLVRHDPS